MRLSLEAVLNKIRRAGARQAAAAVRNREKAPSIRTITLAPNQAKDLSSLKMNIGDITVAEWEEFLAEFFDSRKSDELFIHYSITGLSDIFLSLNNREAQHKNPAKVETCHLFQSNFIDFVAASLEVERKDILAVANIYLNLKELSCKLADHTLSNNAKKRLIAKANHRNRSFSDAGHLSCVIEVQQLRRFLPI